MWKRRRTPPADLPAGTAGEALWSHAVPWALLVAVAVTAYLVFPPPSAVETPVFAAGEVADVDVIAPIGFIVPRTAEELFREREARAAAIPAVYRLDPTAADSARAALRAWFAAVADSVPRGAGAIRAAASRAPIRLTDDEVALLANPVARRELEDAEQRLFDAVYGLSVIEGSLPSAGAQVLAERGSGEEVLIPRDSVLTFADVMQEAEDVHVAGPSASADRLARKLAGALVRPTLVRDELATQRRRDAVRASVDTVRARVGRGERIVTAGQAVSSAQRDKLVALREAATALSGRTGARGMFGPILYDLILLCPFWLLLRLYRRETWGELREMLTLTGLFMIAVAGSAAMARLLPDRPELMPIPFVAILVSMLYNGRVAMVAALVLAMVLGEQPILRDSDALFFGLTGGVAAAIGVRPVRRRYHVYLTVAVVAAAYFVAAATLGLIHGWTARAILVSGAAGTAAALVCAALALLLLPVAELATGITTDLTLLELSDPSRPLLRRLALEAPGTFQHSLSMANLCEAACNAIGANGLLGRVGCLYHDVGKLEDPQYFVENQGTGGNPHDRLKPVQSARIIRHHVEAGLELAARYGLPPVVRAFIPEHHGTSEINYFLDRARGRPGTDVDAADYRYPGPKPRSAETAIAMLADSAEAAVRVLPAPNPEAVRHAIDHLVEQRIASGQLSEAPLTLRDLELVKGAFVRVLGGVYHPRIEYPPSSGGITGEFTGIRRA